MKPELSPPKFPLLVSALVAVAIVVVLASVRSSGKPNPSPAARPAPLPFTDGFTEDVTVEEAGSIAESHDPHWWLDSGAFLYLHGGLGKTVHGSLPSDSQWRKLYAKSSPGETDGGARPQNIFRLLTRDVWQDASEESYFKIDAYDLSADENRSESNGLLLFQRYKDGEDLYYAGVRVDGSAVIKKKIDGTYFTLASEPVFPGTYDRGTSPNLLPTGTWIGLKFEARNVDATHVSLRIFTDVGRTGTWKLAVETVDDGSSFGGPAFAQPGHLGIRTDFMDAQFDRFEVKALDATPSAP